VEPGRQISTPCLKNVTTSSHYNVDIYESILTIFGINVTEKVLYLT